MHSPVANRNFQEEAAEDGSWPALVPKLGGTSGRRCGRTTGGRIRVVDAVPPCRIMCAERRHHRRMNPTRAHVGDPAGGSTMAEATDPPTQPTRPPARTIQALTDCRDAPREAATWPT